MSGTRIDVQESTHALVWVCIMRGLIERRCNMPKRLSKEEKAGRLIEKIKIRLEQVAIEMAKLKDLIG